MSISSSAKLTHMGSLNIDDDMVIDKESMGISKKDHIINVLANEQENVARPNNPAFEDRIEHELRGGHC